MIKDKTAGILFIVLVSVELLLGVTGFIVWILSTIRVITIRPLQYVLNFAVAIFVIPTVLTHIESIRSTRKIRAYHKKIMSEHANKTDKI